MDIENIKDLRTWIDKGKIPVSQTPIGLYIWRG